MTPTTTPLIQSVLVSLNGVIGEPLQWAGPYFGPASAAGSLAALKRSEALLMGRRTYELFAAQWPRTPGPYAEHLNRMRKYVFSSTLTDPTWDNTVVIGGDVAAAVAELKRSAHAELSVYGHGRFGQTLIDAGLVDELRLTIFPVSVAADSSEHRLLFEPGAEAHWELVSAQPGRDPGLAVLTYRPRS